MLPSTASTAAAVVEKLIDSNACAVLNNHDTHTHTHTLHSPITKREGALATLYPYTVAWLYVSPDAGVRVASATYILMVPRCALMAPPRGVQHTSLPSRQRTDSGAS